MLFIFSIYDSAASYYQPPFACNNKGIALREFSDACNNKETFLAKHPADYTLFLLGTFDDITGEFVLEKTPIRLGTAIEFVKVDPVVREKSLGLDDQGCSVN